MTATRARAERADALARDLFGSEDLSELLQSQVPPFDAFSPRYAARIIDGADGGTDIAALLKSWHQEDIDAGRIKPGGRPARVSARSMLILWLMHAMAHKPLTVTQFATTVSFSLTREQLDTVGLTDDGADTSNWYQSISSAKNALQRLVDPYAYPKYRRADEDRPDVPERINRHRILTGPKRQQLQCHWDENTEWNRVRQERLDDLMFEINANVIRIVLDELEDFSGDIALDATYTKVNGHYSSPDITKDAKGVVVEGGLWARGGTHGVSEATAKKRGTSKFKFGFETDIVTMTLAPGQHGFELVLGFNVHPPGRVRHVARTLFPRLERLGLPKGTISVDRLYNDGLKTADFHLPLLQHGYEFAFDYKDDALGTKASFSYQGVDYILVDGTWYLAAMPEDLANAAYNSRLPAEHPGHIDARTLALQIEARKSYQLTRHGRRDADGYQRYRLPDPEGYPPIVDYDTGEVLPKPTNKTVTIPGSIGLKWEQKHPYLSPEWKAAYNLRSAVERKNSQLKRGTTTDLDNAEKRPQRSFVAHSLAITMLITAHNLKQIHEYLRRESGNDHTKGPLKRAGRRNPNHQLPGIRGQKDGRSRARAA